MSEELKACPLCKSDDIACAPIDGYAIWHVVCRKCGAQARGRNKYQAIALWNTRPIEDDLRAQLTASQAEVERLRARYNTVYKYLNDVLEEINDGR